MINTRFTQRFGLRHPIANAPMALIAGGALAEAVSGAGGLGLVAGGYAGTLGGEPDLLTEWAAVSQPQRCGVGFIGWALAQNPAALDALLDLPTARRPGWLFLSFDTPPALIARAAAAGLGIIQQVQRLDQVDAALETASVIVAQGSEAGGHGGSRGTMALLPEVADRLAARASDCLLLAAGGIGDGRGLAAALMLGADGVLLGSRFWASAEALTPEAMVARARAATGDQTVRSRLLDRLRGVAWPEPYSFRTLDNALLDEWREREQQQAVPFGAAAADYVAARQSGDLDRLAVVVGEVTGLIDDRPRAATLLARISAEASACLRRFG